MSVAILDTSVFCNLLDVPGKCQDRDRARADLLRYVEDGVQLLLPLGAVYETGNHIAQATGDRHTLATTFAEEVRKAIEGESPFTAAAFPDLEEVRAWLPSFPERAAQTVGMTDLSIIRLWEQQRALLRRRRVLIWSYDDDLAGYDSAPV